MQIPAIRHERRQHERQGLFAILAVLQLDNSNLSLIVDRRLSSDIRIVSDIQLVVRFYQSQSRLTSSSGTRRLESHQQPADRHRSNFPSDS